MLAQATGDLACVAFMRMAQSRLSVRLADRALWVGRGRWMMAKHARVSGRSVTREGYPLAICYLIAIVFLAAACAAPTRVSKPSTPQLATTTTVIPTATATPAPTVKMSQFHPIQGGVSDAVVGADGNLWFIGSTAVGRITSTGAVRTFSLPSKPLGLIQGSDHLIWVVEGNGTLARVAEDGSIRSFALPKALTYGYQVNSGSLIIGPDGDLWLAATALFTFGAKGGTVTESQPTRFAKVSPAGTVTVYTAPGNGQCSEITNCLTNGSDGNVWFTLSTESATMNIKTAVAQVVSTHGLIGKVTPRGHFTEYPLADPNNIPNDIIAGPGGDIWFDSFKNSSNQSYIGRTTPAGSMTLWPSTNIAASIVAGSDGNLWFTTPTAEGEQPGQITPSGRFTNYSIALSQVAGDHLDSEKYPSVMVAGSDGAVWFTERLWHAIGRIAPDGSVTQYTLPATTYPIDYLGGIAAGANHTIWFWHTPYSNNLQSSPGAIIGVLRW